MFHADWPVDVDRASVRETIGGQCCEHAGVPRGRRKQDSEQQANVRKKLSANVELNQERAF